MSDDAAFVSVVVATVKAGEFLRRCLEALQAQELRPDEIIVVDNGSPEDIGGYVAANFPSARHLRLAENRGFAGGYNAGMKLARGKYIAIINDDAIASPQWLGALVQAAESDPSVGAVASIILDGNRDGVLDSCGVGIALDAMSRQAMRGMRVPAFSGAMEVLLPSGCACLYRSKALEETGLFDEDFFAYCEDTDLGMRLRSAGWNTVAAPEARVAHYYSTTVGPFAASKVFLVERNHFWVAVKNFPLVLLALVPAATLWRYLVQAYAVLAGRGDIGGFFREANALEIARTIIRAQISALGGTPAMFRKRLAFRGKRRLTSRQMTGLIMRFRLSILEVLTGHCDAGK